MGWCSCEEDGERLECRDGGRAQRDRETEGDRPAIPLLRMIFAKMERRKRERVDGGQQSE
jgi:hypothetical protein